MKKKQGRTLDDAEKMLDREIQKEEKALVKAFNRDRNARQWERSIYKAPADNLEDLYSLMRAYKEAVRNPDRKLADPTPPCQPRGSGAITLAELLSTPDPTDAMTPEGIARLLIEMTKVYFAAANSVLRLAEESRNARTPKGRSRDHAS